MNILKDGTLVVSVDDATAVTRVLVEDSKKNGDLYYADRFEVDVVEVIDDNVIMSEETYNALIEASVRPKGKWIDEKEVRPLFDVKIYKCSACGIYADAILASMYKFCPNCGADMRGDNNE